MSIVSDFNYFFTTLANIVKRETALTKMDVYRIHISQAYVYGDLSISQRSIDLKAQLGVQPSKR
jgi:hypothetical protein